MCVQCRLSQRDSEAKLACGAFASLLLPSTASSSPQRGGINNSSKATTGDTQMCNSRKGKPHLRSRLASFHSVSINLKIWRVNMSCLRSGKYVKTKEKYQLEYFQKQSCGEMLPLPSPFLKIIPSMSPDSSLLLYTIHSGFILESM